METAFLFFALNRVFAGVLFIGIILFVLWANKLKAAALRPIVMKFVVVGAVGVFLSALFLQYSGYKMMHKGKMHGYDNDKMMMEYKDSDKMMMEAEEPPSESAEVGIGVTIVDETQ